MRTDISFTNVDNCPVEVILHEDGLTPWAVIKLGTYPMVVTLSVDRDVACQIATKILDELRALLPEPVEAPVEATGPWCDHCGQPVISDGDVRENAPYMEWWTHSATRSGFCRLPSGIDDVSNRAVVNGSYRVMDYASSTGVVRP